MQCALNLSELNHCLAVMWVGSLVLGVNTVDKGRTVERREGERERREWWKEEATEEFRITSSSHSLEVLFCSVIYDYTSLYEYTFPVNYVYEEFPAVSDL